MPSKPSAYLLEKFHAPSAGRRQSGWGGFTWPTGELIFMGIIYQLGSETSYLASLSASYLQDRWNLNECQSAAVSLFAFLYIILRFTLFCDNSVPYSGAVSWGNNFRHVTPNKGISCHIHQNRTAQHRRQAAVMFAVNLSAVSLQLQLQLHLNPNPNTSTNPNLLECNCWQYKRSDKRFRERCLF